MTSFDLLDSFFVVINAFSRRVKSEWSSAPIGRFQAVIRSSGKSILGRWGYGPR
jgi:hypothetical protein